MTEASKNSFFLWAKGKFFRMPQQKQDKTIFFSCLDESRMIVVH